ncbi:ATP-binding cassette domain-containing protein [Streptobacillus ratti]|uniref:ATP-binding cassette domain-containing protein n=1 Tax=Streptobacillus ratti TaxID=1720557 RepID=UPI00093403C3|nr:ABC transporter ATP-binding protein [Streptobacillus ratti]
MFNKIIRKNRLLYFMAIVLSIMASLTSTLFSIQLGNIIDSINKDTDTLIHRILIISLFIFLNILSLILYSCVLNKYVTKVLNELKKILYGNFYNTELMNHDDNKGVNYLNIFTKDTDLLLENYLNPSLKIFSEIFSAGMSIIALGYISIKLSLFFIIISGINILFSNLPGNFITKKTNIYHDKNRNYLQKITKYINGFEQIKLLNLGYIFKEKANVVDDDFEKNRFNYLFSKDISNYFSMTLSLISQILSLSVGIYFAIKGYITIGMLLAAIQLLNTVFMPISKIGHYKNLMKTQKEIITHIDNLFLEKKLELSNIDSNISSIDIQNLTFSFENNLIFNNYSYKFNTNKKYAIIGKSGRGKSTLMKLIMKYFSDDKYNGDILINGKNIKDINSESIYNHIAFIQKNDFLLDESIEDNILLGRKNSNISNITSLLNLNTLIKENKNNSISVGEKQRIDLARFLINDYDVLIFDEPTSNLDPITALKIEDYILSIKNKIVIVITHNHSQELLEKFDEIIEL